MPRLAHLGLGHFFRAHQAWYTERANGLNPDETWAYTAFTGRSPVLAEAMTAGGDRYTLIERGADGDTASTITSVTRSIPGDDADGWVAAFSDPELAVVTVTVTESGYGDAPTAAPTRLLTGIAARRAVGAGPLAVVSCDNLAGNGEVLHGAVARLAEASDLALARWVERNVTFPSTMVDRITPHTDDPLVVVTEPFSEWVIAGDFPAGRPAWHEVGVRFVDDVAPYERRKLWLLNAAHTTMTYLGLLRGLETIDQAWGDAEIRATVEQLWTEVRPVLGQGLSMTLPDDEMDAALAALRPRFANPRIAHRLEQIARQGREKLAQRQQAIMAARIEAGLPAGEACEATIAAFDEIVRKGEFRVD
ncbi:mannitol dehydrogenase family protein [Gryllotalpicola protaetiae]|uniref:Mannitol-1-phosphate 5-dehydrogenase n=1 Tax=Gryllotalpicola protaetiae TaxID=2419771 RepID=A0A387BNR5_9MICO|nr:mannitol dehydrogenase family protein [Gryllotalpicola protaetiae]AYG02646.1 mannitol dehydrogenase family protein [Gryllotalpicola protaetiae]